jgi:membrane-associated phospholipid phosphatase
VVEAFAPYRRSQRNGRHSRPDLGPALLLALPVIALVAWSRIRLGDHTPAQTLAGAALGGLVATTVFILLR